MNNLWQAAWVELLKARRSRVPLVTLVAFLLIPFVGGLFMFILKDPELARQLGLISMKAQLVAGSADWPTFMDMLTQSVAIGGFILFSFIVSWVFGREFADHTISDLLALPTSRSAFVLAKFLLILLWSAVLTAVVYFVGLGVGTAVLPAPPPEGVIWQGTITLLATTGLTILLVTPVAFVASAGRGYLLPMGAAILAVMSAQIVAVTGWGEYFPWAIPALYAGMAGPAYADLGPASFFIVAVAALAGLLATFAWWDMADQTR